MTGKLESMIGEDEGMISENASMRQNNRGDMFRKSESMILQDGGKNEII